MMYYFLLRIWIKHTHIVKDISADPTKYGTIHCCKSTAGEGPFILEDVTVSGCMVRCADGNDYLPFDSMES